MAQGHGHCSDTLIHHSEVPPGLKKVELEVEGRDVQHRSLGDSQPTGHQVRSIIDAMARQSHAISGISSLSLIEPTARQELQGSDKNPGYLLSPELRPGYPVSTHKGPNLNL